MSASQKLRYTLSTKPRQRVHGCLNWYNILNIDLTNRWGIRLRKGKKLLGQIFVEFAETPKKQLTAWLFCFAINPLYRENGYGTMLLKKAEEFIAKNSDAEVVFLHAQKESEDTLIPFYEKRGYKKAQRDPQCNDEYVLWKQL